MQEGDGSKADPSPEVSGARPLPEPSADSISGELLTPEFHALKAGFGSLDCVMGQTTNLPQAVPACSLEAVADSPECS